ncbi:hypothetical protein [Sphingomonas baiyangensis]|uniref:Uncharacterized protein n=1 Tax=Sphingomonas baiyangensis TaxID=2572576 RepID=A0A4U1L0Z7_9SPHN|nr:hypothetical protein [Sphingomonas baiyangensis]TKD50194.1 hypothetical protein FBR43_05070 [Sphingomonas baiyangensis]
MAEASPISAIAKPDADALVASHTATLDLAQEYAERAGIMRKPLMAEIGEIRWAVKFWRPHAGMLGENGIAPRVRGVLTDARIQARLAGKAA